MSDIKIQPNGLWGPIVILDLKSIPESLNFEDWLHIFKTQGIAIYDSNNDGNVPQVINLSAQLKIQIKDANI
jgi:hypothetical protein